MCGVCLCVVCVCVCVWTTTGRSKQQRLGWDRVCVRRWPEAAKQATRRREEQGRARLGGRGSGDVGRLGLEARVPRPTRGLASGVHDVIARRTPTRGTITGSTGPYACLCAVGFGTVGRRAKGAPRPVFFLCPASASGPLEGASNWAAHVNKAHC